MTPILKPCPFCQSPRVRIENGLEHGWGLDEEWRVHCRDCGAIGPLWCHETRAIQFWNARSRDEKRAALFEKVAPDNRGMANGVFVAAAWPLQGIGIN